MRSFSRSRRRSASIVPNGVNIITGSKPGTVISKLADLKKGRKYLVKIGNTKQELRFNSFVKYDGVRPSRTIWELPDNENKTINFKFVDITIKELNPNNNNHNRSQSRRSRSQSRRSQSRRAAHGGRRHGKKSTRKNKKMRNKTSKKK